MIILPLTAMTAFSEVISYSSSAASDFLTVKIIISSELAFYAFFLIPTPAEPNPSSPRFVFPNVSGSDTFSKVTLYFFIKTICAILSPVLIVKVSLGVEINHDNINDSSVI